MTVDISFTEIKLRQLLASHQVPSKPGTQMMKNLPAISDDLDVDLTSPAQAFSYVQLSQRVISTTPWVMVNSSSLKDIETSIIQREKALTRVANNGRDDCFTQNTSQMVPQQGWHSAIVFPSANTRISRYILPVFSKTQIEKTTTHTFAF